MAKIESIKLGNLVFPVHDECIIVREAAEVIGLNPLSAIHHVKEDPVLKDKIQFREVSLNGRYVRNHIAIPVFYFYGWLLHIQIGKAKPEVQAVLKSLYLECCEAIYENFKGSFTGQQSPTPN